MKRLLIGVIAVAGLLGSVLAVAASVASPVAAQTSSVTLENSTAANAGPAGTTATQRQVVVGVNTVNDCNPGNRAPLSSSVTLNAGAADVTGVLSQACNWEVTFRNGDGTCSVSAQVRDTSGANIGAPETDGNLILSGVGGNGPLVYNNMNVGSIQFTVLIATNTCSTSFTPTVNVTVPGADFTGFRFEVSFAPVANSNARCSASGTTTVQIATAQDGTQTSPVAANTTAATLINRPLGANADCVYSVSFPSEVGSLRLQARSATVAGPTGTVSASASTASANYVPISVQISVVSTFPSDEVFDTNDKVSYFISVVAPCGGYVGVIPAGFGTQGDVASVQVFPGAVTVYGSALDPIVIGARTYTVQAFADAAGTQPCTVQVSESSGPERCSPVGGPLQSQTYSSGATSFAFEFTHICEAVVVPVAPSDDAGQGVITPDSDGVPPTPPEIVFPGTEDTTPDTPVTPGTGPSPEGATG